MKLTNKQKLPQPIYEAICNDGYDVDQQDLKTISCTTLISPPKIRLLRARHWDKIEEDASDKFWILIGQSIHSVLERSEDGARLKEERITSQFKDKIVSGKTDLYEDRVLSDYKVTSVWSIVHAPQGKPEWVNQLNVLAYLFRNIGFEVNELRINAILRDWQKTKAFKDDSYPRIPFASIKIPIWTFEEQRKYIEERVNFHASCEGLLDDNIPICTPEERWTTENKYAVYKNKNKTATKLCVTEEEAEKYIETADPKQKWRIELRKGEDKRCKDYCQVNQFCNYYKSKETKCKKKPKK